MTADEQAIVAIGIAAHAAVGRAAVELHGRPRPARVRRTSRRSGSWPPPRRRESEPVHRFPAGAGVHRRRWTGIWRIQKRYALQGYWAGSSVQRQRARRSSCCRKARSTASSGPTRTTSRRTPTRTSLTGNARLDLAFRRSPGRRSASPRTSASRRPGFDINDVGFMRRADTRSMSNWIQWRNDTPSKYLRSFRFNLNQWGDLELRRRPAGSRRQRQRALGVHQPVEHRDGLQRQRARRSTIAPRAARGPAPTATRQWSYWGYVNSDERKRVSVQRLLQHRRRPPRHPLSGLDTGLTVRPTSFLSISGGPSAGTTTCRTSQWVENAADGRYVFGRLDQTTVSLTTRVNYTITPQLTVQIYARAVRLGRGLRSLQAAGERPRRALRGSLRADGVRRQPRLQLPLVPHHERAALGVQARLRAVRRLAAGPRGRARPRAASASAATSAASSARRRGTCSS